MLFWEDFDLVWLLVNSGLTMGILVNLIEKSTLGCTISIQMFTRPLWEYLIFLEFSGFSTQIECGQNMVSLATPSLSNISSAMRGLKHNVILHFATLKLCVEIALFMGWDWSYHDKVELLLLVWERFLLVQLLVTEQILHLFFFSANMLVAMQLGKHARSNYYFWYFAYMFFFLSYKFMPWWCQKIYLLTCLSSIGEPTYVGCYENTWKSIKTK